MLGIERRNKKFSAENFVSRGREQFFVTDKKLTCDRKCTHGSTISTKITSPFWGDYIFVRCRNTLWRHKIKFKYDRICNMKNILYILMSFVLLGLAPSVNAALAPELIVNDAKK